MFDFIKAPLAVTAFVADSAASLNLFNESRAATLPARRTKAKVKAAHAVHKHELAAKLLQIQLEFSQRHDQYELDIATAKAQIKLAAQSKIAGELRVKGLYAELEVLATEGELTQKHIDTFAMVKTKIAESNATLDDLSAKFQEQIITSETNMEANKVTTREATARATAPTSEVLDPLAALAALRNV